LAKLILNGATSGSITLESPAVSGSNTLSLPANTGTVLTTASTFGGTGPAFSAYLGSNQSFTTSTFTKLQFNTEDWDTNNNFDSTTNYRFTPTVAGYYQVNGRFGTLVSSTLLICTIYKNGEDHRRGIDTRASLNAASAINVSAVVYMNGTTDYIELYAFITGTSPGAEGGSNTTSYFQASMVRSA
jgi:hypothetical protein